MAEALAVATAIVAFLDAANKVGKLMTNVIALKDADQAVADAKERIEFARRLLRQIEARRGQFQDTVTVELIAAALRQIEKRLGQLDSIISQLYKVPDSAGNTRVSKRRWLRKQATVKSLLQQLQLDILQVDPIWTVSTTPTSDDTYDQVEVIRPSVNNISKTIGESNVSAHTTHYARCGRLDLSHRPTESTLSQRLGPPVTPTNSFLYFFCFLIIALRGAGPHNKPETIVFYFKFLLPVWLFPRAFIGSIMYDQTSGLSLQGLRFPHYRPTSAKIFEMVGLGNINAIKTAFTVGEASPWDVDIDGNSLLWYALCAFNQNTTDVCHLLLSQGVEPLFEDNTSPGRLSVTFRYAWSMIANESTDLRKAQRLHLYFTTPDTHDPLSNVHNVCAHTDFKVATQDPSCECARRKKYVLTYKRQNGRWKSRRPYWIDFFGAEIAPHMVLTYLSEAVVHHNPKAVDALLSGHVLTRPHRTLNAQNEHGFTALHYAIYYSHTKCLQPLLDAGIDCSKYTSAGHNILHLTAAYGNRCVVEILASSKKLRNISKLRKPCVDVEYLNSLRRTVDYVRVDDRWLQAWMVLLNRCNEEEDLNWTSVLPDVHARSVVEEEDSVEGETRSRTRTVTISETPTIIS